MSRSVDPIEENPFEAPASGRDFKAPADLYKVSIRTLSSEDLRKLAPNRSSYVIFRIWKAIGGEFSTVAANSRDARLVEVPYDSLPDANREAIRDAEQVSQARGLIRHHAYRFPFVAAGPPDVGVLYASDDGRIVANVISQWNRGSGFVTTARCSYAVTSSLGSGRWLSSSNSRGLMFAPPEGWEQRITPDLLPGELLDAHQAWIESRADEIVPIDRRRLLEIQSERQQVHLDLLIERGVLVPLTQKELRTLVRRIESSPRNPPRHPKLVARLHQVMAWSLMLLMISGVGLMISGLFMTPAGHPHPITGLFLTMGVVAFLAMSTLLIARVVVSRW